MSLFPNQLENALNKTLALKQKVDKIFIELGLNLSNKVQMCHYGIAYLFGVEIDENTSKEELINIINSTPSEEYNGHIDFVGTWCLHTKPITRKLYTPKK